MSAKQVLEVGDVDWIDAIELDACRVHVGGDTGRHEVSQRLEDLEKQLGSEKFLRTHRSTIVSIERLEDLEQQFHGDWVAILKRGQRLTVGRS